MTDPAPNDFEKAAREEPRGGSIVVELWDFLKANKKWWLLPIVGVLLLLGVLIALAGTAVAPFIYTLF